MCAITQLKALAPDDISLGTYGSGRLLHDFSAVGYNNFNLTSPHLVYVFSLAALFSGLMKQVLAYPMVSGSEWSDNLR